VDIEPTDDASGFALELLRAAVMLTGLAENLVDAIPADACQGGEKPEAVVIEMVSGTIVTAVAEADPRDVRRATALIAAARERVLEHLRLAVELSSRMHGGGDVGSGRAYG